MKPKVSIILLNWNGWQDTIECLESIYQIDYSNYCVVLVDNASEDNSIKKIKDYCEGKLEIKSNYFDYKITNKPFKIVEFTEKEIMNSELSEKPFIGTSNKELIIINNDKNHGFAKGNNIGIDFVLKDLKSDYILLLNNDTVVDKSFLDVLVNFGEENQKVGILGPMVCDYNEKNVIQSAGALICWKTGRIILLHENELDDGNLSNRIDVDYVEGCALLIKKELLTDLKLLREDYFSYWEETEFCVRVKKLNYDITCIPTAKIWHKKSKTVKKITGFYEYYYMRNMFLFMKEHSKSSDYVIFLLYFFGIRFWFLMGLYLIYYRNLKGTISILKGLAQGIIKST